MTRLTIDRRRHVSTDVVASAGRPTPAEARHLEACPDCRAAVHRLRAFEGRLAAAASTLATVPIPQEVLTMSTPSVRRSGLPSAMSVAVIAALLGAFGLVAFTVLPRTDRGVAAGPSTAPSPAASADPHLVIAGGDVWRIELDGTVIKVHRGPVGGFAPSEGGSSGPDELIATWDLGAFVDGGSSAAIRCPTPGGVDQWILIGHDAPHYAFEADPSFYPPPVWSVTSGPLFRYEGPPAAGQAAPDGLYLYVLDPATFDPSVPIKISAPLERGGSGYGSGALVARPTDLKQPSGCFLAA